MGFGKEGKQSSLQQVDLILMRPSLEGEGSREPLYWNFYHLRQYLTYFLTHQASLGATRGSLDCWCDSNGCLLGSPPATQGAPSPNPAPVWPFFSSPNHPHHQQLLQVSSLQLQLRWWGKSMVWYSQVTFGRTDLQMQRKIQMLRWRRWRVLWAYAGAEWQRLHYGRPPNWKIGHSQSQRSARPALDWTADK